MKKTTMNHKKVLSIKRHHTTASKALRYISLGNKFGWISVKIIPDFQAVRLVRPAQPTACLVSIPAIGPLRLDLWLVSILLIGPSLMDFLVAMTS